MSDQSVKEWVREVGTPPIGRVVLHGEIPVSAGEPVLDDDKGKEVGRLDEAIESGRPVILNISGAVEIVSARMEDGAPVLYVRPHEAGSLAVDEILAR